MEVWFGDSAGGIGRARRNDELNSSIRTYANNHVNVGLSVNIQVACENQQSTPRVTANLHNYPVNIYINKH